jgi:hypothetical protein
MLFLTESLQSKWGFQDGDILTALVENNFPEVEARFKYEMEHEIPCPIPRPNMTTFIDFSFDLAEDFSHLRILPKDPN